MNWKLPSWLNIEIKPLFRPRQKRLPPPWVRYVIKIYTWGLCLLLAWFVGWRIMLYHKIENRFAAIRAAGLPTCGQELNTWQFQPSDAENGALILTQAFALARTFSDSRSNLVVAPGLLKRTNQWSAETHDMVADYVLTNAPALAKIREAGRFDHFLFSADYSFGPGTELPHLGQLKNLARIAALQAVLAAEDGHTREWSDSIASLLKLASALDEEPTLISHLVRNAILRMAVTTAESGLNRHSPDAEACGKLQASFVRIGETNCLEQAFIGEQAIMIPCFRLSWSEIRNLSRSEDDENQPRKPHRYSGKPAFALWITGFFERDLNFYLQTMDKAIALSKLPPPANLVLTNQFEEAGKVAREKFYIMSGMLLPAFSRVAIREATLLTQIRLAETAMAVERFRDVCGRLPENLKELVPQFLESVPDDPFNDSPLRYRRLSKGYVLYGVDSNGRDDNGREKPDRKKSSDTNSYDITFTVER